MVRSFKYLTLSLLVAFALVVTPLTDVDNKAFACCGVYPTIEESLEINGRQVCFFGKITGTQQWPNAYSTGPVSLRIVITTPSGGTIECTPVTFSNLQEFPTATPPYATWDFRCCLDLPNEEGDYTYVKTVGWTSALGWTMTSSVAGRFSFVLPCQCPPGPKGCISGTVRNGTGAPIEGAIVRLFSRYCNVKPPFKKLVKKLTARTDSDGCFIFTDLIDGRYDVYMTGRCGNAGGGGNHQYINIINGSKVNDVNFECQ